MGKHTKENLKKHAEREYRKYSKNYYAKKLHVSFGPPLEYQIWAAANKLMV